jgi:hypothetical protein
VVTVHRFSVYSRQNYLVSKPLRRVCYTTTKTTTSLFMHTRQDSESCFTLTMGGYGVIASFHFSFGQVLSRFLWLDDTAEPGNVHSRCTHQKFYASSLPLSAFVSSNTTFLIQDVVFDRSFPVYSVWGDQRRFTYFNCHPYPSTEGVFDIPSDCLHDRQIFDPTGTQLAKREVQACPTGTYGTLIPGLCIRMLLFF